MRRDRLSKLRRRAATIAVLLGVPSGTTLAWSQHPSYGTGGLVQTFGIVGSSIFAAYVIAGLVIVALEDE